MKKKIRQILNIIMVSFLGLFIGSSLYSCWFYQTHKDLYIGESAPWYTTIIIRGLFISLILVVCMIIKIILIENMALMKKIGLILGVIILFLLMVVAIDLFA